MAPPTNARIVLFGRGVVLVCAAVLSFSALFSLAELCGFARWQAALFPIMLDAGIVVSLAHWSGSVFARRLTVSLLAATVIGNAVAHILKAYSFTPHWSVIVLVGALAPAVLAATWYLDSDVEPKQEPVQEQELQDQDQELDTELDTEPDEDLDTEPDKELDVLERARRMALEGTGRTVLLRELGPEGLTEHQAKQLLRDVKLVKAVAS